MEMKTQQQHSLLNDVFDIGEHVDFISSFVWFNVENDLFNKSMTETHKLISI